MSFQPDVLIKLDFDMEHPEKSVIRTNARPEALEEILGAWIQDQMGRGKDPSPPVERSRYAITIGLRVADDAFATESDCGNKGLATGIVLDVFQRLGSLAVEDLP